MSERRLALFVLAAFTLFVAACVLGNSLAHADEVVCGPHEAMTKGLLAKYHEERIEKRATLTPGRVMEVYQEPHGATWSILLIEIKGDVACLVRSGVGWALDALGQPV